jgi:hypothetical protein
MSDLLALKQQLTACMHNIDQTLQKIDAIEYTLSIPKTDTQNPRDNMQLLTLCLKIKANRLQNQLAQCNAQQKDLRHKILTHILSKPTSYQPSIPLITSQQNNAKITNPITCLPFLWKHNTAQTSEKDQHTTPSPPCCCQ